MTRSGALLLFLLVGAACSYRVHSDFARLFTELDTTLDALPIGGDGELLEPAPFTLRRRELYVGMRGRRELAYLSRAAAIFSSRLDFDALPYGSAISVWTLGDEVVAAELQRNDGGPLLALPAFTQQRIIRFYDGDGAALDGPFIARPVEYDYVSSWYGPRIHPITGREQLHRGVDLSAPRGSPVVSVGDGVVAAAASDAAAGIHVVVRHPRTGLVTKYFHLDALAEGIALNRRVKRGQLIGVVGSTGIATGPHLHFEVLRKGRRLDPLLFEWPAGPKLPRKALAAHRALAAQLRAMTPEEELFAWQDAESPPAS